MSVPGNRNTKTDHRQHLSPDWNIVHRVIVNSVLNPRSPKGSIYGPWNNWSPQDNLGALGLSQEYKFVVP